MDLQEALNGLATFQAMLPDVQAALKERAVQEAVAGGAAVIVRPEYFRLPVRAERGKPANTDPWFALNQWEWQSEIEEGFKDWYEVNEGSGRKKIMISYEGARVWLAAKMAKQQKKRKSGTRGSTSLPLSNKEDAA